MTSSSDLNQAPFDPDLGAVSLKRRSLHGVIATSASQAGKFVLQFGSQIAMAHLLNPAQFGLVAMVYPVLGLVQVFNDLGLTQAIVQRSEVSAAQLSNIFWITVAVSVGLAVLLAGASPLLAWMYHEPRVIGINAVLAALIVISGLSLQQSALLNRRMRFAVLSTIEISSSTTGVVVGIGTAWAGAGYWALVLAQVASSVCSAAMLWICSDWRPSWPTRNAEVASMLRLGGHVTGSNLIGYLNSALDNVLVGAVRGSVDLGLYDRSYKLIVTPMQQLVAPIGRVAVPLLSRLNGSSERYRRAYLQMLQATLLIVTPSLVFAAINARPLVLTFLGAKWADTIPVFAWMCVGALTIPVVISTFWLLISQTRSVEQLRYSAINGVMNISAYAVGVSWGIVGVAQASAFYCWAIQMPLLVWVSTRSGCVGLRSVLPTLLTFLAATLATAAVLASSRLIPGAGFVRMVSDGALSYAVFAVALLVFPTGRRFLADAWALSAPMRGQVGRGVRALAEAVRMGRRPLDDRSVR